MRLELPPPPLCYDSAIAPKMRLKKWSLHADLEGRLAGPSESRQEKVNAKVNRRREGGSSTPDEKRLVQSRPSQGERASKKPTPSSYKIGQVDKRFSVCLSVKRVAWAVNVQGYIVLLRA